MRSQRLGDGAAAQHASADLAADPRQARPARALIAAQLLINALALGMAYALVALGFVLALNAAGAVNFAHGDLVVLGGAVAMAVGLWTGLPGVLLLPVVALALGGAGVVAARVAILPLIARPPEATFVATIALAAMIEQGLTVAMQGAPGTAPALAGAGAFEVAGLVLGRQPVAIAVVGGLLIVAVWLLLERTQVGRRMRAVASDRQMARAVGIPVGRYVTLSLGLAGALAGIAGLLLGHQFLVMPTQGAGHMLKAYMAVALGGWGSVPGALLGALGIGAFETFVSAAIGDAWAAGALYVAVLLLLALRPQGLFGEPVGRRA
ncbi:MAG: branched-chain amino acid ABC transporter permease [Reyranellaceae bacterium]